MESATVPNDLDLSIDFFLPWQEPVVKEQSWCSIEEICRANAEERWTVLQRDWRRLIDARSKSPLRGCVINTTAFTSRTHHDALSEKLVTLIHDEARSEKCESPTLTELDWTWSSTAMDPEIEAFLQSEQHVMKHLVRRPPRPQPMPEICDGLFCFDDCEGFAEESGGPHCIKCADRSKTGETENDRMENDVAMQVVEESSAENTIEKATLSNDQEELAVKDPDAIDACDAQEHSSNMGYMSTMSKTSLEHVLNDPLADATGSEMRQYRQIQNEDLVTDSSFRPRLASAINGMHDYRAALARKEAVSGPRQGQFGFQCSVPNPETQGENGAHGLADTSIEDVADTDNMHNDRTQEQMLQSGKVNRAGEDGELAVALEQPNSMKQVIPVRRSQRIKARYTL